MFSMNAILHSLNDYILQRTSLDGQMTFDGSRILEDDIISNPALLYIGTPASFVRTVDYQNTDAVYTFVLAGTSPALVSYIEMKRHHIIATSLTLAQLCNLIYEMERSILQWQYSLEHYLHSAPCLKMLLKTGADLLQAEAALFNADAKFEMIEHSLHGDWLGSSEEGTAELDDIISTLYAQEKDGSLYYSAVLGSIPYRIASIQYKSAVAAHLLLVQKGIGWNAYFEESTQIFIEHIEKYVALYLSDRYKHDSMMGVLISDIIERKVTGQEELSNRLKQIAVPLKKYYCPIVIESNLEGDRPEVVRLLSDLRNMFPDWVVTQYQSDIIMLAWKKSHQDSLQYDFPLFESWLERHQLYACVGNFTTWLTSLRPLYFQTKGTLQYAKKYSSDSERRLFRFEEFSMYHIIGLCAQYAGEFHDNELVYLSHPGIITLAKYDETNRTDFCAILKQYMMNDRNQAKTARELFFHRNTLQHKINMIETIIGEQLDDPNIRQRLMFSLLVLEYIRDFQKKDYYGKKRKNPSTAEIMATE